VGQIDPLPEIKYVLFLQFVEGLEHIYNPLCLRILTAMRQDSLQQVAGASVMQEKDASP
jgi:hypothetical protein